MADLASPGQGITESELALATRNRGMPLEALRFDVTPMGLHYLLTHFDIPEVDTDGWNVEISGSVEHEMRLTMADIRDRPSVSEVVTMECAGNGRARLDPRPISQPWLNEAVGTASWTGVPLADILVDAGVESDTVEILFTGADRGIEDSVEQQYARSLPFEEAMRPEVLLVYEMNGRPLEPQHGAPLRLLVPGWYGMASVKWLTRIEAITERFQGYYQAATYRFKESDDDPGDPVTRILPRALMVPPGIPDFMDRHRYLDAGPVTLAGRAWSGRAPIEAVQVGIDGDWFDAEIAPGPGDWAWHSWRFAWDADPGEHVLSCRAIDQSGEAQPLEQRWNLLGMGNNHVQEVGVTVRQPEVSPMSEVPV